MVCQIRGTVISGTIFHTLLRFVSIISTDRKRGQPPDTTKHDPTRSTACDQRGSLKAKSSCIFHDKDADNTDVALFLVPSREFLHFKSRLISSLLLVTHEIDHQQHKYTDQSQSFQNHDEARSGVGLERYMVNFLA